MRRWIVFGGAAWLVTMGGSLIAGGVMGGSVAAGCVLGEPEEPGCSEDAECGEGFSCRAGACFRETTGGGFVPPDAGSDADAEGD